MAEDKKQKTDCTMGLLTPNYIELNDKIYRNGRRCLFAIAIPSMTMAVANVIFKMSHDGPSGPAAFALLLQLSAWLGILYGKSRYVYMLVALKLFAIAIIARGKWTGMTMALVILTIIEVSLICFVAFFLPSVRHYMFKRRNMPI